MLFLYVWVIEHMDQGVKLENQLEGEIKFEDEDSKNEEDGGNGPKRRKTYTDQLLASLICDI